MPRPHPTHIRLPPNAPISAQPITSSISRHSSSNPTQYARHQHTPSPSADIQLEWEPGRQPDDVYAALLAPWRNQLRIMLVRRLERESEWISQLQKRIRTEGRDRYFHWTSIFGTHTFFMTFLPLLFFLGYPVKGRGLLHVVGLGIYVSCFSKDLVCTPRPYSPPVTRLTMSTHHHEYGFPSSHSTNSSSIALFIGAWLWTERDIVGLPMMIVGWIILLIYAVSIIGGRIYTGMHSIADIVGGTLMGTACWLLWVLVGDFVESWVETSSISVPLIMIPLTLAMVRYHPEPVDDCPCFEDAIAILSVILGSFLGHWSNLFYDSTETSIYLRPLEVYSPTWAVAVSCARIVFGIAVMFSWRLVIKAALLRILPPIFRKLASRFDLPNRRHYVPATDYTGIPPTPIRTIPSFIDLQSDTVTLTTSPSPSPSPSPTPSPILDPSDTSSSIGSDSATPAFMFAEAQSRRAAPSSTLEVPRSGTDHIGRASANSLVSNSKSGSGLRSRGMVVEKGNNDQKRARDHAESKDPNGAKKLGISSQGALRKGKKRTVPRERYDAEVLTKVVVYTGIGVIATIILPRLFIYFERDVLGLAV